MTMPLSAVSQARNRFATVGVPLFIVAIVLMMVVPLPEVLLDLLLAANLAGAVVILLIAMMVKRPLELSVFPALLLVTTMLRLGLNISSTRLILLHGDAGKVIEAFGNVVVGGNLVVGLVVFLILVIIQFVVITAGAGRVAEVAARFTLDAMPGKQMAIDADLNAGLIDEDEARRRRSEIGREAEFHGAMDGASKFVKGDAIAGIVIVAINLVGGFILGMTQQGMTLAESAHRYSLLSVGDGLVSQVPALLVSVASAILVTRVTSEKDGGGLGEELTGQLGASAQALRIGAGAILLLALVPGMPKVPFLVLSAVLFFLGSRAAKVAPVVEDEPEPVPADPDSVPSLLDNARVEPLELRLAPDLLDLLDSARGGNLMDRVKALRKRTAGELGVVVPPVRTRDDADLPHASYTIHVHGVEVARGEAPPGCALVLGDDLDHLPGRPTVDPVFGLPAAWVREEMAEVLAAEGNTVIDRASVLVTHLAEVVRRNAGDLLGRQEVQVLVDAVKDISPSVAAEVGGDGVSLAEVQAVLRDLLDEGVPIRDLTRILEAVTSRARETRQREQLVEAARAALGAAISTGAAQNGRLAALTLEPLLEQSLLEAVRSGDSGSWLAVDGPRVEAVMGAISDAVVHAENLGHRPALVCSAALRPAIRRLVAPARPDLRVLAYSDLARSLHVEPVGVIRLGSPVAA
jgi:flagellar biosynthesis protein FlhA